MSEFSESYHLRSERTDDVLEILHRAGLKGYIFPPGNGWITFVAENSEFTPQEKIVAAARHPLLHYVSTEDHGWGFALFDQGRAASKYACDWNDDIRVDAAGYSRPVLERMIPCAKPALLDDFEQHLHPESFGDAIEPETSKLFAMAIGLENYDWLDYQHLDRDFHESPELHAQVIKVT